MTRSLEDLLPHRPPMLLLDAPGEQGPDFAEALFRARADMPFYRPGHGVPAWLLIEAFAQTAAQLGGLRARAAGGLPPRGLLLGTRRFDCNVAWLAEDTGLVLRAEQAYEDLNGMASYVCTTRDDHIVAGCTLNVYLPPDSLTAGE